MSNRRLITTAEGTSAAAFSPADWLLFLGPGLIWGSSFFLIAVGLGSLNPALITPMRLGFGLLALSLLPGARRPIQKQDWPRIALLGLLWMAIPLSMFPYAEERVSSALTGMLNGGTPLFAAVVAWILLRRPPGPFQRWGLGLGFLGIVLIALPSLGRGRSEVIGIVLILIAITCYGISINLTVPLQQKYGAIPVFRRAQMVGLALTTPLAVPFVAASRFEWGPVLAVAVLGVFGTGLAYVLMGKLAGRVGGTRASVSTYLIPVVSIILGVVLLDETVHPISLLGSAIVLVGAWLSSRRESLKPQVSRLKLDG
ncbi:MAG: DMT family transporter [Acidimicrobiia bacterium]